MDDSILNYVKRAVNVSIDDTSFDFVLIEYTNSILGVLLQLGYGEEVFEVVNAKQTWDEYAKEYGGVVNPLTKNYIASRVRLLFDPPTGSMLEALKDTIKEFEWRTQIDIEENQNGI